MTTVLASSLDASTTYRRTRRAGSIVFRFGFVYWMLFCLQVASTQVNGFDWLAKVSDPVRDAVDQWFAEHILRLATPLELLNKDSGDKTADWIWLLVIACVAAIAAVVWSVLDRRSANDDRLRGVLRTVMRYTVAYVLFGYGISKLWVGQFQPPSPGTLAQRVGDASPMGLLWTFMGASRAYTAFSGAAEVIGALLLLSRRTTLLGALILAGVLLNVVLLNFCYDVPVKINATHYFAITLYLVLPSVGRLANVILFNRATQPVEVARVPRQRWARVTRWIVKYGITAVVVGYGVYAEIRSSAARERVTWYSGYWAVTAFARDGHDVPPVVTDPSRWRRLRLQLAPGTVYMRWRVMDDSISDLYTAAIDENQQRMTFTPEPSPPQATGVIEMQYTRIDNDHFELAGRVGTHDLTVRLERDAGTRSLLMTRGFHWINEAPFDQ